MTKNNETVLAIATQPLPLGACRVSFDSPLVRPDKEESPGPFEVKGEMTARFELDSEQMRVWQLRNMMGFLYLVRPHIPKRKWRRMRAKVRRQYRESRT